MLLSLLYMVACAGGSGGSSTQESSTEAKKDEVVPKPEVTQHLKVYLDQSGDILNLDHFYRDGIWAPARGDSKPDTTDQQLRLKINDGYVFPNTAFIQGTNKVAGELDLSSDKSYLFKNPNLDNLPKGGSKNKLEMLIINNEGNPIKVNGSEVLVYTTDKFACDNKPGFGYSISTRTCEDI